MSNQVSFLTTFQPIPDPAKGKAELMAKLAARRPLPPAPETFVDTREAVVVKFDQLPEFYKARGITLVTVDFPTTGPYAGQMVVRRREA